MERACYHLPDKLEAESAELMHRFCTEGDPDEDFDEEAWKKFFNANASRALKRAMREMDKVMAKKPDNVRI